MAKRYCEMCETWTSKAECKECGMPTRPLPPVRKS